MWYSMALSGHGYIGRCRFKLRKNSTNCQPSKVTTRMMTDEEMIKYNVKKEDLNKDVQEDTLRIADEVFN